MPDTSERETADFSQWSCPLPLAEYEHVLLGHGSGGTLSANLLQHVILPGLGQQGPPALEDQATVRLADPDRDGSKMPRGSPSRPIRSSSGRSSSPAATSAGWQSTARSTTWRWAARCRCSCRRRSSSRRDCRWAICGGSSPRCARRATRRACRSSPATPRSSIAARATRSSSPPAASGPVRGGRLPQRAERAAGRPDAGLRHDRRPRHRHPVGARGDRVRDGAGKRHGAAERLDARHARGLPANPLDARPDPRRRVQRAERAGRPAPASASGSTKRRSRCGPKCRPPARCSGSIRSTSPTRESSSRSCRRKTPIGCWRPCAATRSGASAAMIGEIVERTCGHGRHAVGDRRRPRRDHARRRTVAENLLNTDILDETAETTIQALQWLFHDYGPPLVLKSDNGSGFIAEAMRNFLDRCQVLPLFSPPRTPEYNGGVEAGNGALKAHTHEQAARQGRRPLRSARHWTADHLEAARRMGNELVYPDGPCGPTRHARFRSAPRISLEDCAAFGRSVGRERIAERSKLGYPLDTDLGHVAQAQVDRVAIGCALVEHGYLTITRRSITPQIKSSLSLGIS